MSHITNPHAISGNLGADIPAILPPFPFGKPSTPLTKELKQLHDRAVSATAQIQAVRDSTSAAASRLRSAKEALSAEVIRGAEHGIDAVLEEKLAIEVAAAERLADGAVFQTRSRVAIRAQRECVGAYLRAAWDAYLDLVDELRPEAEKAAQRLTEALEAARPAQDEYNAIAERVRQLNQVVTVGEWSEYCNKALTLPAAPAVPLPSDEGLAAFERARTEPVSVEQDVTELVAIEVDSVTPPWPEAD